MRQPDRFLPDAFTAENNAVAQVVIAEAITDTECVSQRPQLLDHSRKIVSADVLLLLLFPPGSLLRAVAQRLWRNLAAPARAATPSSTLTTLGKGKIVPKSRCRTTMRAGHRSRTWSGVSASSPQARHQPAGQRRSLHWAHLGDGWRPMRCMYCADPDLCPARSW